MASPVVVSCPVGEWTLVAEAVITGYVHTLDNTLYLQTYRATGEAAPTDNVGAVELRAPGAVISAVDPIDVYVQSVKHDGRVRVDL